MASEPLGTSNSNNMIKYFYKLNLNLNSDRSLILLLQDLYLFGAQQKIIYKV